MFGHYKMYEHQVFFLWGVVFVLSIFVVVIVHNYHL